MAKIMRKLIPIVCAAALGVTCSERVSNSEKEKAKAAEAPQPTERSEMVWYVIGQQNPTNAHSYKPITGARGFNVKFPYDSTNKPSISDVEKRFGKLPANQSYFMLSEKQQVRYGVRRHL